VRQKTTYSFFLGLISSLILFVAFVPSCDDKGTGNFGTPRYGVRELAPAFGAVGAAVRVKAAASRRTPYPDCPLLMVFTVPSTTDEFLIA
jgi:hypothetical protein